MLDRFSGLVDLRVEMSDLTFVFRLDVAMVTNFWAKSAKLANPTFIHHTGIPKQIGGSQQLCEKTKW